jgi:hypothetical protein
LAEKAAEGLTEPDSQTVIDKKKLLLEDDTNLGFGDVTDPELYQKIHHMNPYNSANLRPIRDLMIINTKEDTIDGVLKYVGALKHYCPYWKSVNLIEVSEGENLDPNL